MDKGMYFGSGSENTSKITIDRQNTDKPNGFVFGQSGKGCGIHADEQPSGMALAARQKNENLANVMCHIKPEYRIAIQGDLCCIRELNDQKAKIDILERSGFRRCTVPLECIEIPKNTRTMSNICTEIYRCMNRYLAAEYPDFLQSEDAQLMQQFLQTWM